MSDEPSGQLPDPTTATTVAELIPLLTELRSWAGEPSPEKLRELGATGTIESYVAACLRARDWEPHDIDREVSQWQAVVRRVAPDMDPTQELPIVIPAGGSSAPSATPVSPAAPETVSAPPVSAPRRGRRNLRLALTAALAVGLISLAVPALAMRLDHKPGPLAAWPTTSQPATTAATAPQGDPTPADPVAMAAQPSPSPSPSPTPRPQPSASPNPAPHPPPPASSTTAAPPAASTTSTTPASPTRTKKSTPTTTSSKPSSRGPWSAVVDNSSSRFTASGNWSTGSNSSQRYGRNYRYARPNTERSDAAWYRFNIPQTGRYKVEAWFPAHSSYNDRTPFVIVTTTGNQTVHISQRSNGGRWVSLGVFTLAAGDHNVVGVSRWASGDAYVVADAIRITKV